MPHINYALIREAQPIYIYESLLSIILYQWSQYFIFNTPKIGLELDWKMPSEIEVGLVGVYLANTHDHPHLNEIT